MAHYAKVLDNIVINVIVADDDFNHVEFDDGLGPGDYIQCSYNTAGGVHYDPQTNTPSEDQSKALRYNYPGIGDIYDPAADAFYHPQPFPSWTLDTTTYLWMPPIERPGEGAWCWDEDLYQSDTSDPKTQGWLRPDEFF